MRTNSFWHSDEKKGASDTRQNDSSHDLGEGGGEERDPFAIGTGSGEVIKEGGTWLEGGRLREGNPLPPERGVGNMSSIPKCGQGRGVGIKCASSWLEKVRDCLNYGEKKKGWGGSSFGTVA